MRQPAAGAPQRLWNAGGTMKGEDSTGKSKFLDLKARSMHGPSFLLACTHSCCK